MATKLYLRTGAWREVDWGLANDPGFWDGSDPAVGGYAADSQGGGTRGSLSLTAGVASPGSVTRVRNTVAGPTAGICLEPWVSLPLAAGFTLSGTVTFNLWGLESSLSANAGFLCRLYKLAADGTFTAVVVDSASGTEFGTTIAVRNWTAAPTSTVFEKGDRIVLFVGLDDAGGNMGAGFTASIGHDSADGSAGGSYVQLNESGLSFHDLAVPSGTKLYLTDTASDVDAGVDERELWTAVSGGGVQTAVRNTVAGPTAPLVMTRTAGGTQIEWYTKPLNGFVLSGTVRLRVQMYTSDDLAFKVGWGEIARVDEDGTNVIVWARRGQFPDEATVQYKALDDLKFALVGDLVGPDLTVAGGQRLRCRVGFSEYWHNANAEVMESGDTVSLEYDGSTDATQSWVQLTESVSEFEPPGPVTDAYRIQPAAVF